LIGWSHATWAVMSAKLMSRSTTPSCFAAKSAGGGRSSSFTDAAEKVHQAIDAFFAGA